MKQASSIVQGTSKLGAIGVFPRPGLGSEDAMAMPIHLAVGMFDGVHVGHQAVIRQAVEAAAIEAGHVSAALTFDPHPSRVLYPDMATSLLMPLRQRIRDIHESGADYVFVQSFTREYSVQKAEDFVPALVGQFPGLKSLHVGENFRFGEGRRGNTDTLRSTCQAVGVELHALKRKVMGGMAISSSRIRAALMEGSIDEVNAMLGHPYTARGRVIRGNGIGRKMGFPTLNISWSPEVLPRLGVYHVNLRNENTGQSWPGLANYGLRPTVHDTSDPLLEVHVLDEGAFPDEGDRVCVELLEFIRSEQAFESVEALRAQIATDVDGIRKRGSSLMGGPGESL